MLGAGWSSPVARQAHNLKVTGSNPVPATKFSSPPGSPAQLCNDPPDRSSLRARQALNLKVTGSNPVPAPNCIYFCKAPFEKTGAFFFVALPWPIKRDFIVRR